MAQIKAQDVNWLDEAWRIASVIAGLPSAPPGLLSVESRWPPLTGTAKLVIELLQDTIALHLAYRSKVVHKASITFPDGHKAMFWLHSRDPATTAKAMALLVNIGVKLQKIDLWAYDAHMKLGRILLDRYVCEEWKRQLPLIVASIGGDFTSRSATLKATQPRQVDRRGPLTIAIEQAVRRADDDATISIYYALKADGKVERREGGKVYYYVGDDLQDVTWGRFGVIVSDARKAKAKGLRRRTPRNSMG
ncbi:hypothetical protein [Rhodoferax sp.]|uniref:hypothetical protein n=1 Tax=Rhodoferax sp. TaxID=50421 RepID=UPI002775A110|nr:hypothetical protein [Rhodoferax sp.]